MQMRMKWKKYVNQMRIRYPTGRYPVLERDALACQVNIKAAIRSNLIVISIPDIIYDIMNCNKNESWWEWLQTHPALIYAKNQDYELKLKARHKFKPWT